MNSVLESRNPRRPQHRSQVRKGWWKVIARFKKRQKNPTMQIHYFAELFTLFKMFWIITGQSRDCKDLKLFVLWILTVPTGRPTDLRVAAVQPDSISYVWDAPPCGQRNGEILGYSNILNPANDAEGMSFVGKSLSPEVTVQQLTPCTVYNFSVAALTVIGDGPSDWITATTETASECKKREASMVHCFWPIELVPYAYGFVIIVLILRA